MGTLLTLMRAPFQHCFSGTQQGIHRQAPLNAEAPISLRSEEMRKAISKTEFVKFEVDGIAPQALWLGFLLLPVGIQPEALLSRNISNISTDAFSGFGCG